MSALGAWSHNVSDVADRGLNRTRDATQEERVELARELDILSCERLAVTYLVKPLSKGRYNVSGSLDAEVTQACVVTLEPVPGRLAETFSVELSPPEALAAGEEGEREVLNIPDVEPIENETIAVGDLIFGVLSAALDPYPRQPGVEFDWVDPKLTADPLAVSPFAALAKLKPQS